LDAHRELLSRGVQHEVVQLSRAIASADELPEVLGIEAERCVVVRCYATPTGLAAVLLRAGDVPDPAALLAALGATNARPATADEISSATDQAAGLVGPVGLPADVALLSDSALGAGQSEVLYAATGEVGVALGIRARDLLVAAGARVATLTMPAAQAQPTAAGAGTDLRQRAARRGA